MVTRVLKSDRFSQELENVRHWTLFALTVFLATGCTESPEPTPSSVPIEFMNNFPILEINVDSRQMKVLFDLGGSDQIVLSKEALKSIDVNYLDEPYVWLDAMGNRLESERFTIPEMRIGSMVFHDVSGHVDDEAVTYRKTPAGVGYIGAELIQSVKLVIDYGQNVMTLIPGESPSAREQGCYGTEVPFVAGLEIQPTTNVSTDLGDLVFVWDTGAPMSIVRSSTAENQKLMDDGLHVDNQQFKLAGEDFGPQQLRLLDFVEPVEVDGFVGHDFFANHVVCVDFMAQRFLVRSNR